LSQKLPIRVVRRVDREITEAAAWWRANRPIAPDAFREELQRAFDLITSQPQVGTRARNIKLAGVRRVHLSRIRYYLYYRHTTSKALSKF
jgi:plasmid stabilization system protein ParE